MVTIVECATMWVPEFMGITKRQWSWLQRYVDKCAYDAQGTVIDAVTSFIGKSKVIEPVDCDEVYFTNYVITHYMVLFRYHNVPMYVEFTQHINQYGDESVSWGFGYITSVWPSHRREELMSKFTDCYTQLIK